mmetsp:Transcript_82388/g.150900  ORF Transcript_82388/g.150900 Transcript_82388/m.150900 type:complete len:126 (+) Transcript_82388:13-390(+)
MNYFTQTVQTAACLGKRPDQMPVDVSKVRLGIPSQTLKTPNAELEGRLPVTKPWVVELLFLQSSAQFQSCIKYRVPSQGSLLMLFAKVVDAGLSFRMVLPVCRKSAAMQVLQRWEKDTVAAMPDW